MAKEKKIKKSVLTNRKGRIENQGKVKLKRVFASFIAAITVFITALGLTACSTDKEPIELSIPELSYIEATGEVEWTISPDEPGNYFCIAVNYKIRNYKVDHKKQKFKLFGQGEYVYQYTSEIDIPTEKYLAKNYRYEIDGDIHER